MFSWYSFVIVRGFIIAVILFVCIVNELESRDIHWYIGLRNVLFVIVVAVYHFVCKRVFITDSHCLKPTSDDR